MILRSLLMMDLPPSEEPERSGDGLAVGTVLGGPPAGLRGSIGAGSVAGLRVNIKFDPPLNSQSYQRGTRAQCQTESAPEAGCFDPFRAPVA
jgi:hypothetical protein